MKKIKIALIDHNDSFTFNIVDLLHKIGGNKTTVISYKDLIVKNLVEFDKIILSPGPCLPNDYPKTLEIIRAFYKTKPILGICLGHQIICAYFGATLYNLKEVVHGINKKMYVLEKEVVFKNIPNLTEVGLYHSWAVSTKNLPEEIKILAVTQDKIIMSIKHVEYPIYGIQFHPESFLTTCGKIILNNFII